jgi:transcriptional regulator with XRE-family HTH domain
MTNVKLSEFCQMLIKAREDKGLSVRQAEDDAGIPHGYLENLEAGKYNQPSTHALYKLAMLYEIELKPLLVAGGLIIKKSTHD